MSTPRPIVPSQQQLSGVQTTDHSQAAAGTFYGNVTFGNVVSSSNYYAHQPTGTEKPQPRSTVPFGRDPHFVGREDILERLDQALSEPQVHARRALTGLGGIGKSQIAIEFSHRQRERYPDKWVFWVYASTRDRFVQAYQEIAEVVKIPGRNEPGANTLSLVRGWLCDDRNGPWLMIVDNADDRDVFFGTDSSGGLSTKADRLHRAAFYIPQPTHGAVLITSRNQVGTDFAGGQAFAEEIQQFDEATGAALLGNKLSMHGNDQNVEGLLQALDYIPLAIAQAAAYMSKSRLSVQKYLSLLSRNDANQAQLLSKTWYDLRRDPEVPNAVITSWKISYDQIKQISEPAADLLALMSMLDRQGIAETLILDADSTSIEQQEAIGILLEYSLVAEEARGEETSYTMHRLVQLCVRAWLDSDQLLQRWQERAADLISERFPTPDFKVWSICRALLPHAWRVINDTKDSAWRASQSLLWEKVAWYEGDVGNYTTAEALYRRLLRNRERYLGAEHRQTLRAKSCLADMYMARGRYSEAESLHEWALSGGEDHFDAAFLDKLSALYSLAQLYVMQNRYGEAESLYKRVLAGYQLHPGLTRIKMLETLRSLAAVFDEQGRHNEAEILHRQALAGIEACSGPEHFSVLTTINGLANNCHHRKQYEEAAALYKRALAGNEKSLGADHRSTLTTMYNLAYLEKNRGQYKEAGNLYERAFAGHRRRFGTSHLHTLMIARELASIYEQQGLYVKAEGVLGEVLGELQKHPGVDRSQTLEEARILTMLRRLQQRKEDARSINPQRQDG